MSRLSREIKLKMSQVRGGGKEKRGGEERGKRGGRGGGKGGSGGEDGDEGNDLKNFNDCYYY